jgi:phage/plasmid-like protein (TIGR03299 family)
LYETAGSLKNGKTVWLLAKMPDMQIAGDEIDPYICFTNNHDGTGAIKVCMTPIRVVCNNTLNFALQKASRSWSARHMGNVFSKLEEAKHTLGLANNYMNELKVFSENLATIKFTKDQLEKTFDAMYPINYVTDSKRKIENIEAMKAALFRCYSASDLNNFRETKYGAMMAVTDMVAHAAPSRVTKNWSENNWGKIMVGHPVVDEFYKRIVA